MLKVLCITLLIFFSEWNCYSQKMISLRNEDLVIYPKIRDGKLNGQYKSYYKNGNLRAKGKFENNRRVGKWVLFDSTGKKIVIRKYTSFFEFQPKYPVVENNDLARLLSKTYHPLKRNKEGFYPYYNVREKDIVFLKRNFRYLTPEGNKILFENNLLFNVIRQLIKSKQITVYKTTTKGYNIMKNIDFSRNQNIVAYKIKEEVFYDWSRFVLEWRILSIEVIVENEKGFQGIFKLYYPEIRKFLAKHNLKVKNSSINNLEDVFFFRHFSSVLCSDNYVGGKKEFSESLSNKDFFILEKEHEEWHKFNR